MTGRNVFPKPSVLLKISAGTQFNKANAVMTMNDVVFTRRLNSIFTVPQNCSHSAPAPKFLSATGIAAAVFETPSLALTFFVLGLLSAKLNLQ